MILNVEVVFIISPLIQAFSPYGKRSFVSTHRLALKGALYMEQREPSVEQSQVFASSPVCDFFEEIHFYVETLHANLLD